MIFSTLIALTLFTAVSLLFGHLILLQFNAKGLDPIEWLVAALVLGFGAIGWLAFTLAEFGLFRNWLLVIGVLVIGVLLGVRLLREKRPFLPIKRQLPHTIYLILLIWLSIAGWLFLRPHQFLLGAADAGVYVNLAAHIAENGRILITPETTFANFPELGTLFLRDLGPSSVAPYYLLPGFYSFSETAVTLSPQFYHLQPVMQAIPMLVGGGVQAALLLPGLWAMVASLAIFLTVRQAFGWPAALLALAGLTFNALQIWFARYPTTEALSQLWLWGGIWGATVWLSRRDGSPLWPFLSGVCFGLFFLTRIDAVLILPVLVTLGGWLLFFPTQRRGEAEGGGSRLGKESTQRHEELKGEKKGGDGRFVFAEFGRMSATEKPTQRRGGAEGDGSRLGKESTQRHKELKGEKKGGGSGATRSTNLQPATCNLQLFFWLPTLFLLTHAMLHGYFQSRHYFLDLFGFGLVLLTLNPLLLVTAVFTAIILLILLYVNRQRMARLAKFQNQLRWLLLVIFIIFAIYTGVIRPFITPTLSWTDPFSGNIPILDHENMVRLGWYLSPIGVWAGVLGIGLIIYRLERKTVVLLTVPLLFTFIYIWNIRANPHQIYAMRRYVPAVMPLFIVGTAVLATTLWQQKAQWQRAAGTVLAIAWLAGLLWNARGFVTQVDYANLPPQLTQLADQFDADSVILFNDQASVGQGDILGTPLRFLYQHETFTLRQMNDQTLAHLQPLVAQWQANGRSVYFIHVPPNQTDFLPADMTYIDTYTIETSRLEFSYERKPTAVQPLRWTADIYRIEQVQP